MMKFDIYRRLKKHYSSKELANYYGMTPIQGKYNISDTNLKEIICDAIVNNIDLPLVEVFDKSRYQTLLFDLDFGLQSHSVIDLCILLNFVHIVNECLDKYNENNNINFESYILTKNDLENNIEYKNEKLHFGVHIWFPFIVLKEEDRKLVYSDVLSMSKSKQIFKDIDTNDTYETIIDKCTYQRTSVMVFGCRKIGKQFYKPIYKIPTKDIISCEKIIYNEKDFDLYYSLFRFNKESKYLVSLNKNHTKKKVQIQNIKKQKNDDTNVNWEEIANLINMLKPQRAKEYQPWLEVALCLHNISSSYTMLNLFIQFSMQEESKSEKTDFEKLWNSFEKKETGGLCIGTLKYWAKLDSPILYKEYITNYIDKNMLETYFDSNGNNHHDISKVCLSIWKGLFVNTNLEKNGLGTWYYFDNHRWKRMSGGEKLYISFSTVLNKHYDDKIKEFNKKICQLALDENMDKMDIENQQTNIRKKIENIQKIKNNLKTTRFKKDLMQECKYLFYHENFLDKLDEISRHLLVFNNGVYDLDKHIFREGYPEDYCSYCTNIDYIPFDENNEKIIEVENVFNEMHATREVRNYFFGSMALGLHGHKKENKIDFWTGTGSNGKSLTVEFLSQSLGDYFYSPSVLLLTTKRKSSSNPSPDIMKIKGRRILVFQEPEEDDAICSGFMKSLFGNDIITGRYLHENEVSFRPQASGFLACNMLPANIPGDEGTWRRVKVLHFPYKFIFEKPQMDNEKQADPTIINRIPELSSAFLSLLINHHKLLSQQTKGILTLPQYVKQQTTKYRFNTDIFQAFKHKCIYLLNKNEIKEEKNIKEYDVFELYNLFIKWCYVELKKKDNIPSKRMFQNKMEHKLGPLDFNKNTWNNIKLIHDINYFNECIRLNRENENKFNN